MFLVSASYIVPSNCLSCEDMFLVSASTIVSSNCLSCEDMFLVSASTIVSSNCLSCEDMFLVSASTIVSSNCLSCEDMFLVSASTIVSSNCLSCEDMFLVSASTIVPSNCLSCEDMFLVSASTIVSSNCLSCEDMFLVSASTIVSSNCLSCQDMFLVSASTIVSSYCLSCEDMFLVSASSIVPSNCLSCEDMLLVSASSIPRYSNISPLATATSETTLKQGDKELLIVESFCVSAQILKYLAPGHSNKWKTVKAGRQRASHSGKFLCVSPDTQISRPWPQQQPRYSNISPLATATSGTPLEQGDKELLSVKSFCVSAQILKYLAPETSGTPLEQGDKELLSVKSFCVSAQILKYLAPGHSNKLNTVRAGRQRASQCEKFLCVSPDTQISRPWPQQQPRYSNISPLATATSGTPLEQGDKELLSVKSFCVSAQILKYLAPGHSNKWNTVRAGRQRASQCEKFLCVSPDTQISRPWPAATSGTPLEQGDKELLSVKSFCVSAQILKYLAPGHSNKWNTVRAGRQRASQCEKFLCVSPDTQISRPWPQQQVEHPTSGTPLEQGDKELLSVKSFCVSAQILKYLAPGHSNKWNTVRAGRQRASQCEKFLCVSPDTQISRPWPQQQPRYSNISPLATATSGTPLEQGDKELLSVKSFCVSAQILKYLAPETSGTPLEQGDKDLLIVKSFCVSAQILKYLAPGHSNKWNTPRYSNISPLARANKWNTVRAGRKRASQCEKVFVCQPRYSNISPLATATRGTPLQQGDKAFLNVKSFCVSAQILKYLAPGHSNTWNTVTAGRQSVSQCEKFLSPLATATSGTPLGQGVKAFLSVKSFSRPWPQQQVEHR
ncbi:hypothetical protein RRG08_051725 [Elysia crispata]|uniref:Uncharacterized protein n=1 Tax=Elysia crispata TaxID=231223 RepID=A0AAE1BBA9_9GAST|nr:hypothetical protein RRG08_051725 [Elysia crispata]